jgi:HK97 gp10 family phage protein
VATKVVKIWHGKRIVEILQSELTRRLTASAMLVTRHAKELVGKEGTGTRSKSGAVEPTQARNKKKLIEGAFPSSPGEPPHKQTGHLQRSITWELRRSGLFGRGLIARVGTIVDYGRFLELGTRRMRPRPWLKRSLDAVKPQIKMILSRPMRGPDRGR